MAEHVDSEPIHGAGTSPPSVNAAIVAAARAGDVGEVVRLSRRTQGITQVELAAQCNVSQPTISRIERSTEVHDIKTLRIIINALAIPPQLVGLSPSAGGANSNPPLKSSASSFLAAAGSAFTDEEEALELARRAAASDVGMETLARLQEVVDQLAVDYSVTPPVELLARVRTHLHLVRQFFDAHKTLNEHRRLLVISGWLSLLGATIHTDLRQYGAATAHLRTALDLARQAEHSEIEAWCFETEAWRQLTEGDYRQAVALSQAAQRRAPSGSSAAIQATAQEGRAWAKLGERKDTYDAIARVGKLIAPMDKPAHPEHHYQYDPDKYTAYTATTLAWVGDPAAEVYARDILARLRGAEYDGKWPRRVASANLDLALALLITDRLDEAVSAAQTAILSGRVVPSNHWRALEVVRVVESRQVAEAGELRQAYDAMIRDELP